MEKLGREVLFRTADGIGIGARIGTDKYNRMCKAERFVKIEPVPFAKRVEAFDAINIEELTKVNGIGASTARSLGDAGLISIKGVAEATTDEIVDAGISKKQAVKISNAAKAHLESNAE